MATDYSKKKNDELQELLKARGLAHTGKKAELVARLQEFDAQQSTKSTASAPRADKATAAAAAAPTAGAEDEIDWEDDAAAASTTTGAAAIAAGGQTQAANPIAVPNQAVDTDPSKTSDLKVDPPAARPTTSATETTTAAAATSGDKPAQDFASNLPTTTLDSELEKRKKRAARFGIQESNDDALKALERAKRFGSSAADEKAGVKGLDEALPERRPKRGRGGGEDGADGSNGRQGKRSRVRGERDGGGEKKTGSSGWMGEKDRLAAEARMKRFA